MCGAACLRPNLCVVEGLVDGGRGAEAREGLDVCLGGQQASAL